MVDTLLLHIRTETLQTNLEKIDTFLEKSMRLQHLDKLDDELENIRGTVFEAKRKILQCPRNIEDRSVSDESKEADLKQVDAEIEVILKTASAARKNVEKIRRESFRLQMETVFPEVRDALRKRIEGPTSKLLQIRNTVDRGGAVDKKLWRKFHSCAAKPSQAIFGEYVDLLNGVALRDARFDADLSKADICQIADELIRTYHPHPHRKNQLRTIPARDEATAVTLARFFHLHFPEWTLWALPFTAKEFWSVVAWDHLRGPMEGAEEMAQEQRWQQCLGDMFATYMMGPAYAYATIALRLDPTTPFAVTEAQSSAELRFRAILKILEMTDKMHSNSCRP
jgi:hypothetical protein